jgi:hypothetical protein
MWSGPNANVRPASTTRVTGSPPMRGVASVTAPRVTATAPDDVSWSCQPVSSTTFQQSTQTSMSVSRCSDA